MTARGLAIVVICLAFGGSACSGAPEQEATAAASPTGPACDQVAIAVQQRVDDARAILGEKAPSVADDLEKTIKHLSEDRRGQANHAYSRLKRGIEEITRSSNRLLDRLGETVTQCDSSASPACWPDVTTAYEAAGRTAIAVLQGPLQKMLQRVEGFFTLDEHATTKETKSSYMELRSASKELREGVQQFAEMHNIAAEEFNACSTANGSTATP